MSDENVKIIREADTIFPSGMSINKANDDIVIIEFTAPHVIESGVLTEIRVVGSFAITKKIMDQLIEDFQSKSEDDETKC